MDIIQERKIFFGNGILFFFYYFILIMEFVYGIQSLNDRLTDLSDWSAFMKLFFPLLWLFVIINFFPVRLPYNICECCVCVYIVGVYG